MNKEEVIEEIKSTFSSLKAILSKFSEDELNIVPFEGSWTASQVVEHIIKSIGGIPDEKTQLADRPFDEKIGTIRKMFLNMDVKFKTDPFLEPAEMHTQLSSMRDTLSELEKQHIDTTRKVDLKALCLDMELPKFGYLTRYEWVRFMMVHTQRHTKQIENIYKILKS